MSDIEKVMAALDVHRWKRHNGNELECECGAVVTGEQPGEYYHSPLDEAFRRHIAQAVVEALGGLDVDQIRQVMELAWDQGAQYTMTQFSTDLDFTGVDPAMNPYHRE